MIRSLLPSLKQTTAVAVLGCLIVAGIAAVDGTRASSSQTALVSVNRTNKGDRLTPAAKSAALLRSRSAANSSATKLSASPKGPPLGCDPLFSPIAEPAKARLYYRRCAV